MSMTKDASPTIAHARGGTAAAASLVERDQHPRRGKKRILPLVERRRAGMRVHAADFNVQPFQTLHRRYDSNLQSLALKYGSLFDVKFEKGAHLEFFWSIAEPAALSRLVLEQRAIGGAHTSKTFIVDQARIPG